MAGRCLGRGVLPLRTFAVVTTTHRVSGFIAATAFHTPRSWYPNTLSEDGWFFSFRAGPTIMAIPGRLKFQGYVEVTHIPGVPMARPAPGFTALVFF